MARLTIKPNGPAQAAFLADGAKAVAYIGGIGSGKTFAGLAKAIQLSQQPLDGHKGPKGVIASASYPALRTFVLDPFFDIVTQAGLWKTGKKTTSYNKSEWTARLKANCGCRDRVACAHEAIIHIVSMDDPDWIRGVELSWYFIDESRNVDVQSWKVLWGRLRQKGYKLQGFVCSTPNGFDWMYHKFHPKGRDRVRGARWYTAATFDNRENLPDDYIPALLAEYKGRFARQEVYGEFVGAVDGAVFFEWDMSKLVMPVAYRPELPLYSCWDFGMGALGTVTFFQLEWVSEWPEGETGMEVSVPKLYVLEGLESPNRTSKEWAALVIEHCATVYGTQPLINICDPAGKQRNVSTGTSVVDDLGAYGMKMAPAPKKPVDYGIRLLNNMMAAERFIVSEEAERVWNALASHKWNVNPDGTRIGDKPVHDWTSHYVDALRYAVAMLLRHGVKRVKGKLPEAPKMGTFGHIMAQLAQPQEDFLGGPTERHIEWYPEGGIQPRG